MAITREKIFEAANELEAAGQAPTLAAIRKAIGGGSFTTISEAMSEWKSEKAGKTAYQEPIPEALNEKVKELALSVWQLAANTAHERLQVERDNLSVARRQMAEESKEAEELANGMSSEIEALQQQLKTMQEKLEAEQAAKDSLKEQIIRTTERAITAEARAGEIEKRADNLNKELERVNLRNAELIQLVTEKLAKMT